ncbi:unnamed protein product [Cuscuta epithymum]|uniref:Ubiquitin-like protease family profile domain-containing protein n=1 Tax=Cuscuta epithymum TaxID=186058 RepID=A0AAV0F226_9ASTE|nr:unnamed protein product [Cuscuta epithymum]
MVRTSLTNLAKRALELQIPVRDHFPAQISQCSEYKDAAKLVKSGLTQKQLDEFRKMPWGHLLDVPELQFSAQIVHSLLLRLVCDQPKDELWFCVNDKLLKFTYNDFERITGLRSIGQPPVIPDLDEGNGTLLDKFFGGALEISFGRLTAKMQSMKPKKAGPRGDPLKLACAFYVQCVLLSRNKKTNMNSQFLKLADDLDRFKAYPWAKVSYNLMVSQIKTLMVGQGERFKENKKANPRYKNAKFTLHGLPLVLQVWAYESLPELGQRCAERVGNHDVPLLNWKATGFFHLQTLNEMIFKDHYDEEDEEDDGEDDDGFKSKMMAEMKKLRAQVVSLEARLKVMEDRLVVGSVTEEKHDEDEDAKHQADEDEEQKHDEVAVVEEDHVEVENANESDFNASVPSDEIPAALAEIEKHVEVEKANESDFNASVPSDEIPAALAEIEKHVEVENAKASDLNASVLSDDIVAEHDKQEGRIDERHKAEVEHEKNEEIAHVAEGGHHAHVEGVDMFEACTDDIGQKGQIGDVHEVDNENNSENHDSVSSDKAYWDDVVDEWQAAAKGDLEAEASDVGMKRKKFASKFMLSPFTDPNPKRLKGVNKAKDNLSQVDEWTDFKNWVEGDDSVSPSSVMLRVNELLEVSRSFFRVLVSPDHWMSSTHLHALTYLLNKSICAHTVTLISPYVVHKILKKDIGNDTHWSGDKYLKKLDWKSCLKVLFPLNIENKHWILAEVVFRSRLVRVYDSLKTSRTPFYAKDLCERLPYLLRAIGFCTKDSDLQPWKAVAVDGVPQQKEASGECGVMVLAFAEQLLQGKSLLPDCDYGNMSNKRLEYGIRLWRLKKEDA